MNKEKAIAKINKMGSIGRVVCTIAIVLCSIGILLTLIAMGAAAVMPEGFLTMRGSGEVSVDVDVSKLGQHLNGNGNIGQFNYMGNFIINGIQTNSSDVTVNGDVISTTATIASGGFDFKEMMIPFISAFLIVVMSLISVIFIRRLCTAFRDCSSPFEDTVVRRLRALAFSLIPWVLISGLSGTLSGYALTRTLTTSGSYHLNLDFNLGTLIIVVVILALSYIFKYGAVLQQESDETL